MYLPIPDKNSEKNICGAIISPIVLVVLDIIATGFLPAEQPLNNEELRIA